METAVIETMPMVEPKVRKSSTGKKKKKSSSKQSSDEVGNTNEHPVADDNGNLVTNGFNGNGCGSPPPLSRATDPAPTTPRGGHVTVIDDIKEEEDVVPDLPVYDESVNFGGLRKLARSKSNNDGAESSGEESNHEDSAFEENGHSESGNGNNGHGNYLNLRQLADITNERHGNHYNEMYKTNGSHSNERKPSVEIVITDAAPASNGGRRMSQSRRRGVIDHPNFEQICESEPPSLAPPMHSRRRRASTVDLSRSAQKLLLKISGNTNPYDISPTPTPEPVYCNPEMEIFRQRRLSQQNQSRRRLSLAEAIADWPSLEVTEKPEYRVKEVKEAEASEAQSIELRKMDPTAIYKMDYWIDELVDHTCVEREPRVTMSCKYSNPNGKVHWFKNHLEIFHGHKYNFENENGTFRLVIFRLCLEDTGLYICQTDDKSTSAELTVEAKQVEYNFISPLPESASVKQKGDLILECHLSDSKPPVVWRINGDVIEYTPGLYEIFRRDDRCILKIRNVPRYLDKVEFSCEVVGDRTTCRLTVDEPEFYFKRKLTDVDVYEKETATLECEMNDEEAPVKWFKDNKAINTSSSKYSVNDDGVKRQLLINNVSASDEGVYSCTVQSRQTAAKLYVSPDVVIRERLDNTQKVEHETVHLQCKVKNPKNYAVTWLKDGKQLSTDNRYEISCCKDGKIHSLTIKALRMSDSGVYTCKIGDRDTSATLNVTESHTPPKVDVSTVPRELVVKCGKNIEIDIPYTGTPKPAMKWTKNGRLLQDGGSVSLEQTANACVLRISNARRSDSADYEMELTNDSGSEVIPITVKVIGKPLEPEGPIKVADVYKEKCHLLWEPPVDDGGIGIDYYLVEMQDVGAGRKWTEVGRVQGDTQCGIPNLEAGKKYKFRVRACNQEGESEPLATEKETLAKDPWDVPGKPGKPDIVDYDKDRADIHWTASLNDGGNPIQKYVIEERCLPDPTWQTVGMVLPAELYAIIPNLQLGKSYEFRVLAVNQAGRGEPSDPSTAVCIKPTRVPPKIDSNSYSEQIRLKSGRDFNVEVRFTGNPPPSASWTRTDSKDVNCCKNVTIVNSSTGSQLACSSACRANAGTYRLHAVNSHGQDSAEINIIVISVPESPVGPLRVTEVRKSSAVIHWQPPVDDGGRPCTNFVVERMNKASKQWERVSSSVPATATQFKVSRLEEGQSYLFRVFAENDQGSGEALMTEFETEAKNPFVAPSSPDVPEIVDSNTNFIKIRWRKPANDGGAEITGYYVERRDKNTGAWIRLNEQPITELEYTDFTVKDKKQYEYRVIAENEGGSSAPSNQSIPVKARLFKEQGHIQGVSINGGSSQKGVGKDGKDCNGTAAIRAGGTIRIDLQISGSPPPVVTWFKDNQPIVSNNRAFQQSDDDNACLQILQANRLDSGTYSARVQNEFGFEMSSFAITVLDVPSCPQNLRVEEVFSDHCRLSWKPPRDDGGSEIMGYSVDVCEEGFSVWEKVTSCSAGLSYTAKELRNGRTYKFRVRAENLYGASVPLETSSVLAKNPFNAPGEPERPEVVDSDKDFILIKWKQPPSDGGSPIQGYIIERKDPLSNKWVRLNSQLLTATEYRDRAVQAGKNYEYRITAVNAGGASDYSETSGQIKAKPLKAIPSIGLMSPSALSLQATVGETLTLSVPISGSPTPTITWLKNGQLISQSARVKILNGEDVARLCIYGSNIDDSGTYTISLANIYGQVTGTISVNIIGGSQRRFNRARSVEPSSDRSTFANKEELFNHSPAFSFPLRNRLIQQGVGVKLIACVSARPLPKVTWYKDNREVTNNSKYSTSFSFGVCSLEIVSCSVEDAGKYTCVATNLSGKSETSCRIVVNERGLRRQSFSVSRTFSEEFTSTPSSSRLRGFTYD